ncbi:hypothetical protein FBQ96_13890, partial [Nitrospirales bacterium NOB]|nr:hypothetical protein [Nitrospirales bacterium NOB]
MIRNRSSQPKSGPSCGSVAGSGCCRRFSRWRSTSHRAAGRRVDRAKDTTGAVTHVAAPVLYRANAPSRGGLAVSCGSVRGRGPVASVQSLPAAVSGPLSMSSHRATAGGSSLWPPARSVTPLRFPSAWPAFSWAPRKPAELQDCLFPTPVVSIEPCILLNVNQESLYRIHPGVCMSEVSGPKRLRKPTLPCGPVIEWAATCHDGASPAMIEFHWMSRGCTWGAALLLGLSVGCTQAAVSTPVVSREPAPPPPSTAGIATFDYWRDIHPIIERRCVVCHGCYDSPCQLNLSAYEGLARGANKKPVYDGTRLLAAEPTRLFEDAHTVAAWREKDFFPVLQEQAQATVQERRAGVVARSLLLKQAHPLPPDPLLPDTFDLGLDAKQQCPTESQFERFAEKHPLWGMPYGLPGLNDQEHRILMQWIEEGAPYREANQTASALPVQVGEWETFLNGETPKQQLMSRYLYEHLHLVHLYFDTRQDGRWYRLVRSRSAPGQPIDLIATRRPYDDPGVSRVYYRLQPLRDSLLAKTHIPYALNPLRMQRYRELFLDAPDEVRAVPSYEVGVASNPFVAFRDLPVRSRYRFLLDDALVFVMQFIKGPVCRGHVALDVIDDRFWIFFVDPDSGALDQKEEFLAENSRHLYMPTPEGASPLGLISWLKYSRMQDEFLKAKQAYIERLNLRDEASDLSFIWDGRRENRNAALTVFRHADSSSVVQGLVGDEPKTAWLLSYDLFERIYYLLVAGFDVYSFAGHQLDTRLYMDFLRMEGEFNFLLLLPHQERERLRDFWYRDAPQTVKDYVYGRHISVRKESGIRYRTNEPKRELFGLLRERLGEANPLFRKTETLCDREMVRGLTYWQRG